MPYWWSRTIDWAFPVLSKRRDALSNDWIDELSAQKNEVVVLAETIP